MNYSGEIHEMKILCSKNGFLRVYSPCVLQEFHVFHLYLYLYFAYISTQFEVVFYLNLPIFSTNSVFIFFICILPMIATALSDWHQAAGCYSWLAGFPIKIFILIFFVFLSRLFCICASTVLHGLLYNIRFVFVMYILEYKYFS